MSITIDNAEVTEITIDNEAVEEVTIDGEVVWMSDYEPGSPPGTLYDEGAGASNWTFADTEEEEGDTKVYSKESDHLHLRIEVAAGDDDFIQLTARTVREYVWEKDASYHFQMRLDIAAENAGAGTLLASMGAFDGVANMGTNQTGLNVELSTVVLVNVSKTSRAFIRARIRRGEQAGHVDLKVKYFSVEKWEE